MARKFVLPLCIAERAQGYNSHIFCSDNCDELKFYIYIPFKITGKYLLLFPVYLLQIGLCLLKNKDAVIVCHNTTSAFIPLLISYFLKIRRRVYFNHGVPFVGYSGVVRRLLYQIERINIKFCTEVLTVSSVMQSYLENLNDEKKLIRVIHHGSACGIEPVDSKANTISPDVRVIRQRESRLTILFVGRPEKRKGFHLVLSLWNDYMLGADCMLVLCGPDRSDVESYLGLVPENIIALGHRIDMAEIYCSCDVLWLPSLHEGLPYSVLEAFSVGKPVVVNEIPGITTLVETGKTGWLVHNNSIEDYVAIFAMLMQFPSLASALAQNCIEVAAKFSRKEFMMSYLRWLKSDRLDFRDE